MNKYFNIILFGLLILNGCGENETASELIERINDQFNEKFTTKEKSTNQKLISLLNEKDSNGNYSYAMPSAGWPEDNLGNRGNLIYYRDGSGKATLGGYSALVTESGSWWLDWDSRACHDNSTAELSFLINHGVKFSNVIGVSNTYRSRLENAFSDTSLVNEIYSLINSDCHSYIKNNNLMIGVHDALDECKEDGNYFDKYLAIKKDPVWGNTTLIRGSQPEYSAKTYYPIWNTLIDSVKYTIKDCKIVEYTVFHKEQKAFTNDYGNEQPDLLPDEYWREKYYYKKPGDKREEEKDIADWPASTRHNNKACEGHTFKYNNGKKHGVWADDEVYKNGSKMPGWDRYYTYYSNGNVETITNYESGWMHGLRYTFYESGNFKDETNIVYGKKDGLYTEWFENGLKSMQGSYKNDKEEGLWSFWDENGALIGSGAFRDGKAIK